MGVLRILDAGQWKDLAVSVPAPAVGARNVIRNGDMQIAQRGNGPFVASGKTLDGWEVGIAGNGTVSTTRSIPAPGVSAPQLVTVITAQDVYTDITTRIENVNTLSGQQVTFSFLIMANAAGLSVQPFLGQRFGTGGSPSASVFTFGTTFAVPTALTRITQTVTLPSVSGKVLGTSGTDQLSFALRVTGNGTIRFTDVQLEAGLTATPFERLPIQQQLAWCQRYFQRIGSNNPNMPFHPGGWISFGPVAVNGTWSRILLPLPVAMRAVPSVVSTGADSFVVSIEGADIPNTGVNWWPNNPLVVEAQILHSAAAVSPGYCGTLYQNAATPCYIDISAEL